MLTRLGLADEPTCALDSASGARVREGKMLPIEVDKAAAAALLQRPELPVKPNSCPSNARIDWLQARDARLAQPCGHAQAAGAAVAE
ncbi:hypothetical protein [Roseateles sp.]|uniref:hypothetical protein n=1 Tax=Roseateles sp. TaxID=1971397 RepID=UPI00286A2E16|nr:hypothetical protein [Roseateles sp.]